MAVSSVCVVMIFVVVVILRKWNVGIVMVSVILQDSIEIACKCICKWIGSKSERILHAKL